MGGWIEMIFTQRRVRRATRVASDVFSFAVGGLAGLAAVALWAGPADAAGGAKSPEHHHWHFNGPFGAYDKAALQRGYQVYKEVCAACHSMDYVAFRHLGQKGGPFYDSAYANPNDNPVVQAVARQFGEDIRLVRVLDEAGDEAERPPEPSDYIPGPYRNIAQARAVNGGAYPTDFSVITKARHYGADYIRSLLIGYTYEVPDALEVPPGQWWNPYFPGDVSESWSGDPSKVPYGGFIAMAPPLREGVLEYTDGTEASVEQMAADVSEFLNWAADPHLESRKSMGISVMGYLVILAGLLWVSYHQIWRNVKK